MWASFGKLFLPRLERVMGIEPTSSAWKAEVLPLNYTRRSHLPVSLITRLSQACKNPDSLNV